jgi:O-methyltransferase involved in polyketide biosynthesis
VEVDLSDPVARRTLFASAGSSGTAVVITEGLLVYLEPEQVRALAEDLHGQPALRWWLGDLSSPLLVQRVARQWGTKLAAAGTPWKFAPAEGTKFFEPAGWRELEFRSMWRESRRLKREMPLAWLWRLLGTFMPAEKRKLYERMSGVMKLERV